MKKLLILTALCAATAFSNDKYLIITAPQWQSGLTAFIADKQGTFNVMVVTTATTGTTKQAIKAYIQNVYDTSAVHPLKYLLLVGDVSAIPTWQYGDLNYMNSGVSHMDLYYGTLAGANTDLGGPSQSIACNYHPDIGVGRVIVSNTTQLANWSRKTLTARGGRKFVSFSGVDTTALGCADGNTGDCRTYGRDAMTDMVWYKTNYFTPMGWTGPNISGRDNGTNAVQLFYAAMNSGVDFCVYSGHGAPNAFIAIDNSGSTFTTWDVSQLANTRYPIVFAMGCETAELQNPGGLGETFVTATNGACVYLGSQRVSSFCEDGWMNRGFMTQLRDYPNSTVWECMNAGLLMIDQEFAATTDPAIIALHKTRVQRYWEQYYIIGDPAATFSYAGACAITCLYPRQ